MKKGWVWHQITLEGLTYHKTNHIYIYIYTHISEHNKNLSIQQILEFTCLKAKNIKKNYHFVVLNNGLGCSMTSEWVFKELQNILKIKS